MPRILRCPTLTLAATSRLLVVSVVLLFPTTVGAQCVTQSFAANRADPHVARIFLGTATSSVPVTFSNAALRTRSPGLRDWRGQAVTFKVDRVWKGPATSTVVVYNVTEGSEPAARGQGMHTFEFNVGDRYFLRAYVMNPEVRVSLGLATDGAEAFTAGCPLRESRDPMAERLVDADPGIAIVTR